MRLGISCTCTRAVLMFGQVFWLNTKEVSWQSEVEVLVDELAHFHYCQTFLVERIARAFKVKPLKP